MLTRNEVRLTHFICFISCKSFTIPLIWEDEVLSFKVVQQTHWRVLAQIVWVLACSKLCFQLYYLFNTPLSDINNLILEGVVFLVGVSLLTYRITIRKYKHELVRAVNEHLLLNRRWGSEFFDREISKNTTREIVYFASVSICVLGMFMVLLVCIVTRNQFYSPYQLFQTQPGVLPSFISFNIFLILEVVLVLDGCVQSMICYCALYGCCFTMQFWLKKICIAWPTSLCLSTDPTKVRRLIVLYKGIYLMNDNFNVAFGSLILPCIKLACILVFTMCFFAIVRLSHLLNIYLFNHMSLMGPLSFVMSSLYDMSSRFPLRTGPELNYILDKQTRQGFEAQLRSCELIRCKIGNFYHMEARAKLTLFHNVVDGIVFWLVNT